MCTLLKELCVTSLSPAALAPQEECWMEKADSLSQLFPGRAREIWLVLVLPIFLMHMSGDLWPVDKEWAGVTARCRPCAPMLLWAHCSAALCPHRQLMLQVMHSTSRAALWAVGTSSLVMHV